MRSITIWVPSKILRMTLWEGTPDAEMFEIKGLTTDHPHVDAYGEKVYLTDEETKYAKKMKRDFKDWRMCI